LEEFIDNIEDIKITYENLCEKYELLLENYQKFDKDINKWSENDWKSKVYKNLTDFSKLFQDYISCANNLKNFSISFKNGLNNDAFSEEYANKLKDLTNSEWFYFLIDLINFGRHKTLPCRHATLEYNSNSKKWVQIIVLHSDEISKTFNLKKWSSKGKEYLNNNSRVEIKPIIIEYHQKIKKFYEWFFNRINDFMNG